MTSVMADSSSFEFNSTDISFGINCTALTVNSTTNGTDCGTEFVIPQIVPLSGIPGSGPCDEGVAYFRWVAAVIITPPIITFGIIGNILSFIVLCVQKPYLTTTVLLRYLAIIDTLLLLLAIPLRTVRQIQWCHGVMMDYHFIYSTVIFRWSYPCIFILRSAGTWLITLLTVDRYIAVCKPLHAQRLVTLKVAYRQIILVTLLSIVFFLPTFFEFHFVRRGIYAALMYREFATSTWYIFSYKVAFVFLIMYIIPMAIMIIFNSNLAIGLRMAAKDRALLHRSVSSDSTRLNNSVTAIVIAIVVTFITCNTVALVSHTLYSIVQCFPSLKEDIDEPRRYITIVNDIFISINSAINFLIYCVFSRSFRATFVRVFSCRSCRSKNDIIRNQGIRQSNGSHTTYLSLLSNGTNKHNKLKESLKKQTSNSSKNDNAFQIYD